MEYVEISIITNTYASEYIAHVLTELTREGVSIYDKNDYSVGNWDYSNDNESSEEVIVKGFIPKSDFKGISTELLARLEEARKFFGDVGSLDTFFNIIESDAWRDVWKETYKPVKLGEITICPVWESRGITSSVNTVVIDPGLAFGTGQHETTASIIDLLQEINVKGKTVFDVGSGSGILGLCALKLGAKEVTFFDNDEQAIKCTEENIKYNTFSGKFRVIKNNLLSNINKKCDILVANLTVDLIKLLDIKGHVTKSGCAVLSGILFSRLKEIKDFIDKDFTVIKELTSGEWSTLLITGK